MDLGLAGAAAVVTGGSKGMGRAAAECLAADGARVAVIARGQAALDETVAALEALAVPMRSASPPTSATAPRSTTRSRGSMPAGAR